MHKVKYEKIKANNRNAKKNVFKKLRENENIITLFKKKQTAIEKWKMKKLFKKRYDEKKFDKFFKYYILLLY